MPSVQATRNWEEYTEWCRTAMSIRISDALHVRDLPELGERGIFATRDISPGECLLAVPFDSLLTVASTLRCTPELQQRAMALSAILAQLTREDDALGLRLLWERHEMKHDSRWAAHVDVLPASYPHAAVGWSEEELEELTGSNVKLLAERWRLQVVSDFESLSKLRLPEVMGGETMEAYFPWFDLEAYKWALGTVWSRCCSVQKDERVLKALGPFFDLFNHKIGCEMQHGLALCSNPSEKDSTGEECLTIVSRQAWAEGQEVGLDRFTCCSL